MEKLRYNRTFKNGVFAISFCILLFSYITVFFIASKVQYDSLVSKMKPIKATIVDIDIKIHARGPNEQEIYITYEVDGVTYSRQLKTDTKISFAAGIGAHYSIGDKIDIFYDPQDPEVIASPRSVGVGYFYMFIGLIGWALVSYALFYVVKNRRKFLVTQQEYVKEKEERKKRKSARRGRRK